MNERITIEYDEVYAKCAQLRAVLSDQQADTKGKYGRMRAAMGQMDGQVNGLLDGAMRLNEQKGDILCTAAFNLLNFIEQSARHVQQDEHKIAASYTMGSESTGGAS